MGGEPGREARLLPFPREPVGWPARLRGRARKAGSLALPALSLGREAGCFARKPESVVEDAITGMLPHTKLGRAMASKLKVYRGDKHPHQSQKPEKLELAK